jgi:hypothetical protein
MTPADTRYMRGAGQRSGGQCAHTRCAPRPEPQTQRIDVRLFINLSALNARGPRLYRNLRLAVPTRNFPPNLRPTFCGMGGESVGVLARYGGCACSDRLHWSTSGPGSLDFDCGSGWLVCRAT